jgi:hypothetical protein
LHLMQFSLTMYVMLVSWHLQAPGRTQAQR